MEPISHKSEVLMQYKSYKAWLDVQHHAKIKCFQMDHSSKYLSEEFSAHLKSCSTIQNLTVHDTPEENGVSKCLNHTLLEHA